MGSFKLTNAVRSQMFYMYDVCRIDIHIRKVRAHWFAAVLKNHHWCVAVCKRWPNTTSRKLTHYSLANVGPISARDGNKSNHYLTLAQRFITISWKGCDVMEKWQFDPECDMYTYVNNTGSNSTVTMSNTLQHTRVRVTGLRSWPNTLQRIPLLTVGLPR